MEEKLVCRFNLRSIGKLETLEAIITSGYNQTGNKFTVSIHGSKGYLSHICISCEGQQKAENRLFFQQPIKDSRGRFKPLKINVFHAETSGVRLSVGEDKPTTIIEW